MLLRRDARSVHLKVWGSTLAALALAAFVAVPAAVPLALGGPPGLASLRADVRTLAALGVAASQRTASRRFENRPASGTAPPRAGASSGALAAVHRPGPRVELPFAPLRAAVMRTLDVQDDEAEDDGVASRREREQPWRMPSDAIVFIGTASLALAAIIGLGIGIMLRRVSVARAVARADVAAGVPFELRFPGASRKHRVLLTFEVEHPGDEDDEGLTARLDVHATGHGPVSIEHRIGNHAPAISENFTQNTARYAVLITSEGARSTTTATVPIASIGRAEGDVIILGRLLLAEGQTARRLFVYVVPG